MQKKEQERLSKYGKLVWDFAIAKTTDDILISFFENLQAAFNFLKNFKEKALTQFPTKKMIIDPLTRKENNLFEILLNRDKILKSCNDVFHSVYRHIDTACCPKHFNVYSIAVTICDE